MGGGQLQQTGHCIKCSCLQTIFLLAARTHGEVYVYHMNRWKDNVSDS